MAIAPKPGTKKTTPAQQNEKQIEAFINKAVAPTAAAPDEPVEEETKRTPVMLRFDRDLLKRVDDAAKRRGISRSAWVQYTVSKALDEDQG